MALGKTGDASVFPVVESAGDGSVWLQTDADALERLDPPTGRVVRTIRIPIVGSTNAYEIFLIFYNILAARFAATRPGVKACAEKIAYRLHSIEQHGVDQFQRGVVGERLVQQLFERFFDIGQMWLPFRESESSQI